MYDLKDHRLQHHSDRIDEEELNIRVIDAVRVELPGCDLMNQTGYQEDQDSRKHSSDGSIPCQTAWKQVDQES